MSRGDLFDCRLGLSWWLMCFVWPFTKLYLHSIFEDLQYVLDSSRTQESISNYAVLKNDKHKNSPPIQKFTTIAQQLKFHISSVSWVDG
jgi:hypothetical protein